MHTKFDFFEEKNYVYAPIETKREVTEDEVWRKRLPRVIPIRVRHRELLESSSGTWDPFSSVWI